jgi:hypothetical protein
VQLYQQMQLGTQAQSDRAGNAIQFADEQIERYQEMMRQMEELQTEWDKLRRIGEIVRAFRSRVEALDPRI